MSVKIQLTMSEDYCPSWGLFEGVREFLQNARDATRSGCSFDAFYSPQDSRLVITTKGAVLSHKTLLMGESSKRGRSDMLGEHGEGYKVGSLVLCRLGKRIKIRTGTEVWQPALEYSKKFDANLLTFDIVGGRKNRDEVVVEIFGITEDEWYPVSKQFLFLEAHDHDQVETPAGSVLVDGCGEVFVDGIWLRKDADLRHGYDFHPGDVRLDRDRREIDSFHARTLAARIWEAMYLRIDKQYCDLVDEMLADEAADVAHFQYEWCVGQEARREVAESFKRKFGAEAVPVSTESEAREMEFYGRKGEVVQSASLRNVLEREIGNLDTVRRSVAEKVKDQYDIMDIDPDESKHLLAAIQFVTRALGRDSLSIHNDLAVVEFTDPRIMGMRKQGKIYMSRNCLGSFEEALKTLVEEVAHEVDRDGTHSHVEMIHTIYAQGVSAMLEEQ